VLVVSGTDSTMYAVDLDTGVRTVISSDTIPNGNHTLSLAVDVALDSGNGRALAVVPVTANPFASIRVIAINLATGQRTIGRVCS